MASVKFDGPHAFYLGPNAPSNDNVLWKVDLAPSKGAGYPISPAGTTVNGGNVENNLSYEEKLRRERLREYSTGITSYHVGESMVLYNQQGSIYAMSKGEEPVGPVLVLHKSTVAAQCGGNADAPLLDVKLSPSGRWVSFVHDSELHVAQLPEDLSSHATSAPGITEVYRLTSGARGNERLKNGLAEYIAEEELDRHDGCWWAPGGDYLVYQCTDESGVEEYEIAARVPENSVKSPSAASVGLDGWARLTPTKPYSEKHRYPFAGQRNAVVRLFAIDVRAIVGAHALTTPPATRAAAAHDLLHDKAKHVELSLGVNPSDTYVARVWWTQGGDEPFIVMLLSNRLQNCFDLVAFSPKQAAGYLLLREVTTTGWLNVHDCFQVLKHHQQLIWGSECSGFRHLYSWAVDFTQLAHSLGLAEGSSPSAPYEGPSTNPSIPLALVPIAVEASSSSSSFSQLSASPLLTFQGAITGGQWLVHDIAGVSGSGDAAGSGGAGVSETPLIFFHAIGAGDTSPLELHLWCAPLAAHVHGREVALSTPTSEGSGTPVLSTAEATNSLPKGIDLAPRTTAIRAAVSRHAAEPASAAHHLPMVRITSGPGYHTCTLSASCDTLADELSCVYVKQQSLAFYTLDLSDLVGRFPPSAVVHAAGLGEGEKPAAIAGTWADKSRLRGSTTRPFHDGDDDVDMLKRTPHHGPSSLIPSLVDFVSSGDFVSTVPSKSELFHPSSHSHTHTKHRLLGVALGKLPHPMAASVVHSGHIQLLEAAGEGTLAAAAARLKAQLEEVALARAAGPGFLQSVWSMIAPSPPESTDEAPDSETGLRPKVLLSGEDAVEYGSLDALAVPMIVVTKAADGVTPMYGSLTLPVDAPTSGPYPTVTYVYGGPHVQIIRNACDFRNGGRSGRSAFAARGCAVAVFDSRGSFNRGAAFERALWLAMGSVEVADQAAGIAWLARAGITDTARVGIQGWSYGGYMTLMCLAHAPEVFRAGVAGAPVTDWKFYDTAYTERYMSLPTLNPIGYENSSVLTAAAKLRGRPFLIIHGNIDENVHFKNSEQLCAAIASAATGSACAHHLVELPGERHGARGVAAAVREATVAFLCQQLGLGRGETSAPPTD